MSHLWPHTPYAEDQPHHTAILTIHVLYRGFQTGAVIGPLVGSLRYALSARRTTASSTIPFSHVLLRSTGTGALWGVGILSVSLPVRMWGREEIEWRDRAWRLLENKGQVEVDGWGLAGMGLGAVGGLLLRRKGVRGWRVGVGAVGMGSTAGVLGYMVWRHGVKGGKWEEAVPDIEGVTT